MNGLKMQEWESIMQKRESIMQEGVE